MLQLLHETSKTIRAVVVITSGWVEVTNSQLTQDALRSRYYSGVTKGSSRMLDLFVMSANVWALSNWFLG